jgi:hypothetical protein
MQLQPRMKAGLLLLAIAGTIIVTSGSAQARHWRGGYYRGWGGYGGYGWYGGSPYYGYGYGSPAYGYAYNTYPSYGYGGTYANYAPNTQPMYANQAAPAYAAQNGGCNSTTAAYPPSGPMPGQPGAYNGTTYDGAPPTPTYAPGTMAPPVTGQAGDNANQHDAAMNPTMGGRPQPGSSDTANQHNATAPPLSAAAAPPSPGSTSDTANQHNTP